MVTAALHKTLFLDEIIVASNKCQPESGTKWSGGGDLTAVGKEKGERGLGLGLRCIVDL